MTELELKIIKVGQEAIGAYEKGNYADFCRLEAEQRKLKEELWYEKVKNMDLKDLIEVNW